jgi:pilin/secretion family protein with methylation motif
MCLQCSQPSASPKLRAAFSLLELVVAISIMVIIMGSMGALSKAVNEGALYGETYGNATQHARVAMERIAATVRGATTSDQFPGLIVLEETVGGWEFPDILVVWHPDGSPADPEGLPRVNELRVYCPNPDTPNELLEVTFPSDPRIAPLPSDKAGWLAEAANMKDSQRGVRTVLTNMLRTARVSDLAESERGAVRFNVRYRPSETEMDSYAAGSANWDDLAWPQGIYTNNIGLRQAWLRMEFQVVPGSTNVGVQSSEETAIPFLGSASRLYEVHP